MSKPMLVTLPFVLLLLDYWPLRRVSSDGGRGAGGGIQHPASESRGTTLSRLVIEKVPFFLLAALSCWITAVAQSSSKAMMPDSFYPLEERLANVPVAYGWYLLKLCWPVNLANPYPLIRSRPEWMIGAASLLVAVLTLLAIRQARGKPWWFVGWFWFVGMLVPVSGIMQAGNQAYADRYTYLPYIGLFILLSWGIPALLGGWRFRRPVLVTGAALTAVACVIGTSVQLRFWKDTRSLFERAVAVNPGNSIAWYGLGLLWSDQGQWARAIECFQQAGTGGDLSFHGIKDRLGLAFMAEHRFAEAEAAFRDALRLAPNNADVHSHLAAALNGSGRVDEAIVEYEICLVLDPNHVTANCSLADLELARGQYAEAVKHYRSALEQADLLPVHIKLGQALAVQGRQDEAIAQFQQALRLDSENAAAQFGLAAALDNVGRSAEAIAHYRQTIRLDTNSAGPFNNLAWLLATSSDKNLRDGPEAVRLAERACDLTQQREPLLLGTLAAAYAEAGQFDKAIATAEAARDLAQKAGLKYVAERNEELLKLYRAGKAYHQDTAEGQSGNAER